MELITRSSKGSELEWQDMDGDLNAIRDAINYFMSAGYITQVQAQALITKTAILSALGFTPADAATLSQFQTASQVLAAIQTVVGAAPSALDTLQEIAAQLQNDESAASALTTVVGNKVDKVVGKGLSTNDYTNAAAAAVATIASKASADVLVPLTATATTNCDLSVGSVFKVALGMSTTLAFLNPPASGVPVSFTVDLVIGGAYAVTWPSSIKWVGGIAPLLTATQGKQDTFSFITLDGGVSYLGFVAGQNL